MTLDLPLIWAGIIAFAVLMYVLLDGFDLGIGILFPFNPDRRDRDVMMNSIAPEWDGNETWLVLGGGGLLAAFPGAYAVLLPALYLPIIVMLLALVFRGVAFEFRFKAERSRAVWDTAFAAGSALAALSQGVVLGGFIQGVNVVNGEFAGGSFDWCTPFALMTGLGVASGYALLGAGWLIVKAEGGLRERAYRSARIALVCVAVFMAVVSLWTPLEHGFVAARWFTLPNLFFLAPVPLLTAAALLYGWVAIARQHNWGPFIAGLLLFLLGYLGLAISLWPFAVPYNVTVRQAAAADPGLMLMMVGVVVIMPLVLIYTAHNYWVFRGKTGHDGYH